MPLLPGPGVRRSERGGDAPNRVPQRPWRLLHQTHQCCVYRYRSGHGSAVTPTWQGSWGNDQRKRRFRRTAGCCINCNSSRFRFFAIVTDLVGTPTELIDDQGNTAWRTRSTLW
ncbi:hypothetical protein GTW38_03175, partial [Streptomyces sp. SID7804]|nr:hypothetical protein [Streptomyces sp. SID7804]